MLSLRIVIIDDEVRIRTSLKHLLSMYYPSASVVSEAGDIDAGEEEIKKHQPDVVLLDIKMPGGSGLDLVKKLGNFKFKLIFITAFDQYAVEAFKLSALDYLMKPVNPDELVSALQKAQQQIMAGELNMKFEALMNNMASHSKESRRIVLKTQDIVHVLNVCDIIRCEADRNYTRFVVNSKNILVSGSLKEYEDMLSNSGFFRSHHSHLINISYIERFEKQNLQLVMKDSSVVPLATRKKDELLQILERI